MANLLKLGDVATFTNGGAWKQTEYADSGIPVVRVTDIKNHSVNLQDCKYLPRSLYEKYRKHELRKGDLVICTVGSHPSQPGSVVGRTATIPSEAHGALLNQNAVIVRAANSSVKQGWLNQLARTDSFHAYIKSCARGAASQVRMSISLLREMPVTVPSIHSQYSITNVLRAYDDLIENNSKRIEKIEAMAYLLYSYTVKDIEHTTILGEKLSPKKGKNITKATVSKGDVPVVAGGLTPAYYHDTPNTKAPVITVSASGANAGYVNIYYQDIWASDCSYIDSEITPFVYYYYTLLKDRQFAITHMQKGSAQPHVYPADLEKLKIPDLSDHEIKRLSSKLNPIYEQIRVLSAKNQILTKTRNLLLPRLMSGEIEV